MRKILALVRHATATSNDPLGDFYRSLSDRGFEEAKVTSNRILKIWEDHLIEAPMIVSSPALRTKQTAATIVEAFSANSNFGDSLNIDHENDLYRGEPEDWYHLLDNIHQFTKALVVVGHNPGISFIGTELGEQTLNFRPGDFAVFEQVYVNNSIHEKKWKLIEGSIYL